MKGNTKKIQSAQKAAQQTLKNLKKLTTLMWSLSVEEKAMIVELEPTVALRLDSACDLVDSLEWKLWSAANRNA
jgi:hypothetical protein